MKPLNNIFLSLLVVMCSIGGTAQVAMGTATPSGNAALDISSTTKGFLPPRMTSEQKTAIVNPPGGLMVWCTDCGAFGEMQIFNGSVWTNLTGTTASTNLACGTYTVTFTYNGNLVTYGTVSSTGSKCWLDRNLGATQVATSSTDTAAYGDLFQWGRGDDGHQVRNSGTTSTLSPTDAPGHGNFITNNTNTNPPDPLDWRNPQNSNLWQGINAINNPCPIGWRLPTNAELKAEYESWGNQNSNGAFASPLKLTMAGNRMGTNGTLSNVGSNGYYWSSDIFYLNNFNSYYVNFTNGSITNTGGTRSSGYSVRCIKN